MKIAPPRSSRREFLEGALLCGGLFAAGRVGGDAEEAASMPEVRERTLRFIESMRVTEGPFGAYRYAAESTKPTLYSSTYAAMTRHLYRDFESLDSAQRDAWVAYLQSHQDDDGLFRDPVIFGEGMYKDDPLWCGRPHLTCHVLTALRCLNATTAKPLRWLEPYLDREKLIVWMEQRNWGRDVAWSGNEVLNVGTLLQYARDFHHDERCGPALDTMLAWMEERCDPATGLWGVGALDLNNPLDRSHGVQAAYHFWLLWFYDRKPIPYAEKALEQVLLTQNPQGGFGWGVHNGVVPFDSSACEDIDSIDPLARLISSAGERKTEVSKALTSSEPWVLSNRTADGGLCFMKGREFAYGHPQLSSGAGAGAMFPTWFRTLTLAYVGKGAPDSMAGSVAWQFCDCPGLQFWKT